MRRLGYKQGILLVHCSPHFTYDLRWWADRIREWQDEGGAVFAYFNNDGHGHAVRNAWRLRELLGA